MAILQSSLLYEQVQELHLRQQTLLAYVQDRQAYLQQLLKHTLPTALRNLESERLDRLQREALNGRIARTRLRPPVAENAVLNIQQRLSLLPQLKQISFVPRSWWLQFVRGIDYPSLAACLPSDLVPERDPHNPNAICLASDKGAGRSKEARSSSLPCALPRSPSPDAPASPAELLKSSQTPANLSGDIGAPSSPRRETEDQGGARNTESLLPQNNEPGLGQGGDVTKSSRLVMTVVPGQNAIEDYGHSPSTKDVEGGAARGHNSHAESEPREREDDAETERCLREREKNSHELPPAGIAARAERTEEAASENEGDSFPVTAFTRFSSAVENAGTAPMCSGALASSRASDCGNGKGELLVVPSVACDNSSFSPLSACSALPTSPGGPASPVSQPFVEDSPKAKPCCSRVGGERRSEGEPLPSCIAAERPATPPRREVDYTGILCPHFLHGKWRAVSSAAEVWAFRTASRGASAAGERLPPHPSVNG